MFAFFAALAARRPVDVDEGSYLLAAKLALDGVVPYSDFLYTQMPLLPYVYGAWTVLVGESWLWARFLSACFAAALGGTSVPRPRTALRATGLPGSDSRSTWLLLSSSPGMRRSRRTRLSTLFLFGAYALVLRGSSASRARWFGAGVLTALAIDTRLIFAVVLPAVVWAAWRVQVNGRTRRTNRARRRSCSWASHRQWSCFAIDPGRFVFDNLGYHSARNPEGLLGNIDQKLEVMAGMLGFSPYLLLLLGALVAGVVLHRLEGRVPLSVLLGGSLSAGSLAPTPTYDQYFCTAVPFLAVASVELVAAIRDRSGLRTDAMLRHVAWSAGALTLAIYVGLGAYNLASLVGSTSRPFARIGSVGRVAAVVDERTRPGEQVLTSWPGYLFGTHARAVPGTENDFAAHAALELSPREVDRYQLATGAELESEIRERRPRVVVFKIWHELPPKPVWDELAERSGYRFVEDVDSVRIYELPRR